MQPVVRALCATLVLSLAGTGVAHAQSIADAIVPKGVVNLTASASVDVARDLMTITLSTTREGTDAAAVQSQLKQALDAALVEARRAARPGQVDVQTGNFQLYPRYAPKGGAITGWQGNAELAIEGRDLPALSQLAGRISSLTVARVGYGLSREVREKAEGEASAQAIARYRAKASEYAQRFGYSSYVIREVHVNTNEPAPPRPMMMSKAMAAPSDEALPVEAGKASVIVNVSGSIQMQ